MALLLTAKDILTALPYEVVIETVADGFRRFTVGAYTMPQRSVMTIDRGLLVTMPAADHEIMAIKVATANPRNPESGAPSIQATVLLLREETGELLSILDGTSLTIVRTCAVSAVATQLLANSGATDLGVLGSGPLAVGHIRALTKVSSLQRVKVYSPRIQQRWESIRSHLADLDLDLEQAKSAEQAVRGAGIVVLATSSREPVIDWDWVNPGTHINAVGSHTPKTRELDTNTVVRSRVVCDSQEACWIEAGDLLIPLAEGAIDRAHASVGLGEVLLGRTLGRQSRDEVTIFKSVGLAFEDLCTAHAAWRIAGQTGLGSIWKP